jgi:IAA-amino acid hydrolase
MSTFVEMFIVSIDVIIIFQIIYLTYSYGKENSVMKYMNEIINLAKQNEERMISLRRQIHRCPEVAYHEYETAKVIRAELEHLNIRYKECGTGTIADIGPASGKLVALRADIDALPITEETDFEFASCNPGYMHACGHDCHTAMLLNTAAILSHLQDHLPGPVRLIFQPAEEGGGGARGMISAGAVENVTSIFCLHMRPGMPSGVFATKPGLIHASSDGFLVRIHGRKSHGANPEKGVDAILIAAHTVLALQEIISREISAHDNAVLSIGKINGGQARNIVCEEVTLDCTLRTLSEEKRQYIRQRINDIVTGTATMYRGSAEIDYVQNYCTCWNDETETDFSVRLAEELFADTPVTILKNASMGGEDFGFYQQLVPGTKLYIGTGCQEGLHTSTFRVDESGLYRGAALLAAIGINRYL